MEENNRGTKDYSKSLMKVLIFIILVIAIVLGVYYINNKMNEGTKVSNTIKTQNTIANEVKNENTVTNTVKETNTTEKFRMTEAEFPKVDGATAMLPMVGEITKAVLGFTEAQAQKYLDENTQGKSAKVYASLINKEKDLIFVSEPSDDILRQAQNAGVEFDNTGIGLDGFVFLINKNNPVESLTLEQIRDIYTGKITNWKDVGGEDAEIFPYQREQNSGSQNLMEKMVMKGEKMAPAKSSDMQIESMSGLIDSVANGDNSRYSIGYSIYLYAKEQYVKDSVKFVKINGVSATDENITNKTYPLTKIVYAVTRKDVPQESSARKLIKWLLTPAGQKVVEAGGYVKLYK